VRSAASTQSVALCWVRVHLVFLLVHVPHSLLQPILQTLTAPTTTLQAFMSAAACPADRLTRLHLGRGQRFASTMAVMPMMAAFVRNIDQFVHDGGVDLVGFQKGQREDDVTRKYVRKFTQRQGVHYVERPRRGSCVRSVAAPSARFRQSVGHATRPVRRPSRSPDRLTHVPTAGRSWVRGRSDVRQIPLQAKELSPNGVVDLGHGLFRLDRARLGTAHLVLGIGELIFRSDDARLGALQFAFCLAPGRRSVDEAALIYSSLTSRPSSRPLRHHRRISSTAGASRSSRHSRRAGKPVQPEHSQREQNHGHSRHHPRKLHPGGHWTLH
jgi:hypothetical protein